MSERALQQKRHASRLRLFAGSAAALGWLGLGLQLWVILQVRQAAGLGAAGGIFNFLSYFTIWSNLLASLALSCHASGLRSRGALTLSAPGAMTAIGSYMALVGITYHAVLRNLWHPTGVQLLADNLLHTAMPALFLIFWWIFVAPARVNWRAALRWTLLPAAYLLFALLRGAVDGFYAYPFLDEARIGYSRVFVNAIAVLLVFAGMSMALMWLDRRKR